MEQQPETLQVTPQMRKAVEAARNYIILRNQAFAELMLWVPTEIDLSVPYLAYATRSKTYVSKGFFELPLAQQAAVIVHEVMHVICQHVRATQKGHFHPVLANVAQDILINESIDSQSWLSLPKNAVRFKNWVPKSSCRWEKYSWQQLYWLLLKTLPRARSNSAYTLSIDSSYFPPDWTPKDTLQIPQEFQPDLDTHKDKAPSDSEENHEEFETQVWQQRLHRALSRNSSGGLLRALSHLVPSHKVNWRHLLRKALQVNLQRARQEEWTRPGRRTLAKVIPYYEPHITPPPKAPSICVVLDTSGSIDEETLQGFAAEVESLRRQYQVEIYLMGCDCQVKGELRIRSDSKPLLQHLKAQPHLLKGGGGTDFRPALKRAEELQPRLCVYFTDMQGTFGDPPKKTRVLWVTESDVQPPFGQVVKIR